VLVYLVELSSLALLGVSLSNDVGLIAVLYYNIFNNLTSLYNLQTITFFINHHSVYSRASSSILMKPVIGHESDGEQVYREGKYVEKN